MTSNEQKARKLVAEAKKKLSSVRTFLSSLFGSSGTSSADEAADCYQRAANLYKMEKDWNSAAEAFLSAAKLHEQSNCAHETASNYVDAAKCLRKFDIDEAVDKLSRAIEFYTDMGRFTIAARHHQTVAEMYESKGILFVDKTTHHYEKAADYFRCEESNSAALKCLLKVAQYASQSENYGKAISIYQDAAESALRSSLLRFSAREYLFRAVLCQLTMDVLTAQHVITTYVEMYPAFEDSREYKLLQMLIECIEEQNKEAFTQAVYNYDKVSSLDQWYTMMLLRIKRQLYDEPDIR